MGLFDRLFGRGRFAPPHSRPPRAGSPPDSDALARYRYLLRTAPPEAVEEVHREAFARLTPEQRARTLRELNAAVPLREQVWRDDPASLARLATRAELLTPGTLVRTLGRPGLGGLFAGGLLSSLVGSVLGTMLAHELLDDLHDVPDLAEVPPEGALGEVPGTPLEAEGPEVTETDWGGGDDTFQGDTWGADFLDDV